ncbi:MAG: hypothetical protein JKY37_14695 [Nannocystaceae bacterium]|nr:hypothetical protein [Nannocystaceae bacterium]
MSVSLIPWSRFVPIRDEAHALLLLRDAGVRETDDELRRLTQQLLDGRLLLVREEIPPELDDWSSSHAPRHRCRTLSLQTRWTAVIPSRMSRPSQRRGSR